MLCGFFHGNMNEYLSIPYKKALKYWWKLNTSLAYIPVSLSGFVKSSQITGKPTAALVMIHRSHIPCTTYRQGHWRESILFCIFTIYETLRMETCESCTFYTSWALWVTWLFSCLRGGMFQFKTRTTPNMSAKHRKRKISKRCDKKTHHEPDSEQPIDNLGDAFSLCWSRQDWDIQNGCLCPSHWLSHY